MTQPRQPERCAWCGSRRELHSIAEWNSHQRKARIYQAAVNYDPLARHIAEICEGLQAKLREEAKHQKEKECKSE